MNSSGSTDGPAVEYPTLQNTSDTLSGPSSNNSDGKSTATPSNGAHEEVPSGRQTRSSGRGANIELRSLGSEDDLDESELRQAREAEIERIINGGVDEALGQFHLASEAEMSAVYRKLCALTHPDKQSEDAWKEKATRAQQSKSMHQDE